MYQEVINSAFPHICHLGHLRWPTFGGRVTGRYHINREFTHFVQSLNEVVGPGRAVLRAAEYRDAEGLGWAEVGWQDGWRVGGRALGSFFPLGDSGGVVMVGRCLG